MKKCEVYKSAIPYLLLPYGLNMISTVQVCLIFWRSNAWKVSHYKLFFSGSYFSIFVFSPKTGKDSPEKTLYLETFHAVYVVILLTNMASYDLNK